MRKNCAVGDLPCPFEIIEGVPVNRRFRLYLEQIPGRESLRRGDVLNPALDVFRPLSGLLKLNDAVEVVGEDWEFEVIVAGRYPYAGPFICAPADFNEHRDDASPYSVIDRLLFEQYEATLATRKQPKEPGVLAPGKLAKVVKS